MTASANLPGRGPRPWRTALAAGLFRLAGARVGARDLRLVLSAGLFDADWYATTYRDRIGEERPLHHYLREGAAAGLEPNAWFKSADYVRRFPDAGEGGRLPFAHFLQTVLDAGLDPTNRSDILRFLETERTPVSPPRVAPQRRRRTAPGTSESVLQSLHEAADIRLMEESGLIDAEWYASAYPEIAVTRLTPLEHYVAIGVFDGNDPGPDFSTAGYLRDNPDVAASGANPLLHYLKFGRREGRLPGRLRRRITDLFPTVVREGSAEYGPIGRLVDYDAPPPDASTGTLCIHLHLFYPDQAESMVLALRNVVGTYALLVSIGDDEPEHVWREYFTVALPDTVSVLVRRVPNRGRDVMPWLTVFADAIRRFDLFCHIHTKRSPHRRQHRDWGRFVLHSTLGSAGVVDGIRAMFAGEPRLGLVFPPYFADLKAQPNWGDNKSACLALLERMGLTDQPLVDCPDYPAGSFFWARPAALAPLFDLELREDDFEAEPGPSDGTLAHAIERLVGVVPRLAGYEAACVGVDIAFNLGRFFPARRAMPALPSPYLGGRARPVSTRIAVCTAGGPARPLGCTRIQPGAHYYCFAAGPPVDLPAGYRTIQLRTGTDHHRSTKAGFAKTHLTTYFASYDLVFWHDPDVAFGGDLQAYADELTATGADAGFIIDPMAPTILEGADRAVATAPHLRSSILDRLHGPGPDERVSSSPLFDPSFFVIRPRAPAVQAFSAAWWQELGALPGAEGLALSFAVQESGARIAALLPEGWSPRDHADFAVVAPDHPQRDELHAWLGGYAPGPAWASAG